MQELYSEAANCNNPNDDNQQKITKKTAGNVLPQQGQPQGQPEALNGNTGIVISGHPTEVVRMQGATENTSKDDIPNIASNCWGRVFINPRFNQQRKRGKKKVLKNKDNNFFLHFFKKVILSL